ncbi:hypothetical protein, partial [Neptuniibacter marinus]
LSFTQVNENLKSLELKGNTRKSVNLEPYIYDDLSKIRNYHENKIDLKLLLDVYPNLNELYISGYKVIDTDILSFNDKITSLSL